MSLQYLILGILKYGPASGYELNKAFQASAQHFWHTEQSQIYRALYRLEDEGWVEVEEIIQDGVPNKKEYRLTSNGRTELHRWLVETKSLTAVREAWIGQLFFGNELNVAEMEVVLQARIAVLQQAIIAFEREIPAQCAEYAALYNAADDAWFWNLTIDYGLRKLQFDLQWAQEALAKIKAHAK